MWAVTNRWRTLGCHECSAEWGWGAVHNSVRKQWALTLSSLCTQIPPCFFKSLIIFSRGFVHSRSVQSSVNIPAFEQKSQNILCDMEISLPAWPACQGRWFSLCTLPFWRLFSAVPGRMWNCWSGPEEATKRTGVLLLWRWGCSPGEGSRKTSQPLRVPKGPSGGLEMDLG